VLMSTAAPHLTAHARTSPHTHARTAST
jgi:hypothetical protein